MVRAKVDVTHDRMSDVKTEAAEYVALATMVLMPQTFNGRIRFSVRGNTWNYILMVPIRKRT